jgi:hypothetical protein
LGLQTPWTQSACLPGWTICHLLMFNVCIFLFVFVLFLFSFCLWFVLFLIVVYCFLNFIFV